MQRSKKTTGRGAYFKGRTLRPGTPGDANAFPDDVVPQPLPKLGTMQATTKHYQASGAKNWEAYSMEEMAALLNIPGYKYVPVPKAWDGVLVPADEVGNLDPRKSVTDIIYADIKKTKRGGPPALSANQVEGAERFPVRIIHFIWPNPAPGKANVPASAVLRKGPNRSTWASPRIRQTAKDAEGIQNKSKKRKLGQ